MANNTISANLEVTDTGSTVKQRIKDMQGLNAETEKLNKSKSAAVYKAESMDYGVARAISGGGTGAAGRDFAKQAQGLSGLVHVYATFAANLFAVSAAFRALSDAADTTNMIKGMDQLGAQTGRSLGTIAKSLQVASDGAISMRDAIEATTKGSAAGLSNKQMLEMAEVAKKASQALGMSMPEALSRLSRGVSKLEPELLDELGLYTKLEKANQDYARSIGKTVTQLTDFEKRQAFANAVLKEGLDKFSSINIDVNPYDKLLASLKNVAQAGLEVVNGLLTPLVRLLASSPTGLSIVLAGIGTMLLKQAIPALGQFRKSIAATAEESRLNFAKIYHEQQRSLGDLAGVAAVNAEAAYRASSTVRKQVEALKESANSAWDSSKKKWSELAAKNPFELTSEELKALDNRAKTLAKSNADEASALKAHVQKIKELRSGKIQAGDVAEAAVVSGTTGVFTTPRQNEILYNRQLQQASADAIKTRVAETQSIYGARAAFAALGTELNKARAGMLEVHVGTDELGNAIMAKVPAIGAFRAGMTGLAASLEIVGTKIAKTLEVLGPYAAAVGIAIEAFSLLDDWLSQSVREQEAFKKALDTSKDAVENVNRTIDQLSKKDPASRATISGIFALSNAMTELKDATDATIYTQEKFKLSLSGHWWDRAKENVLSLFGKDTDTKLAESLGASVESAMKIFAESGQAKEANEAFKKALGIESLDAETVVQAFKDNKNAAIDFQKAQTDLTNKLSATSSRLQTFKSATEQSTRAYQEFIQATANTNPLFKIGAALEDVVFSMEAVTKDGLKGVNAAFDDLAKNPEKFALFGKDFAEQFVGMRKEFTETFSAYERFNKGIEALDKEKEGIQAKIKVSEKYAANSPDRSRQEIALLQQQLKDVDLKKASLRAPDTKIFEDAKNLFLSGIDKAAVKSNEIIVTALGQAAEKAALTIAQAKLGTLTGEGAAVETTRLKMQELNIQMRAIDVNISLIKANEELKAVIEESTAAAEASRTEGKTETQKALDQASLLAARTFKDILQTGSSLKDIPSTGNKDADTLLRLKAAGISRQIGQQEASKTEVGAKQAAAAIEGQRTKLQGQFQDLEKIKNANDAITQQEVTRLGALNAITNAATDQTMQQQSSLENTILQNKQYLEQLGYINAIHLAAANGQRVEVEKQSTLLALVIKRQEGERDNKGIADRIKLYDMLQASIKAIRDEEYKGNEITQRFTEQELAYSKDILDVRVSQSSITDEEADKLKHVIERNSTILTYEKALLKLQQDRSNELDAINRKLVVVGENKGETDRLEAEKKAVEARYTREIELVDTVKANKLEAMALDEQMGTHMKGVAKVFDDSIGTMADALVEFAKTGKLNFQNLITDMLGNLLKFELEYQMSSLYKGAGGFQGILGMISGKFTPGSDNFVGPVQPTAESSSAPLFAKGGMFDSGVQRFAKGGSFTNQIVTDPTLFKFASGTGLMGEAGPEAIMPLKRDGKGNLGVTTGGEQPKTSVVVNNYSNQQATTNETVDSRGNRKIEVIVGDMVADQIGRAGSTAQQAMTMNYGARPTLVRR